MKNDAQNVRITRAETVGHWYKQNKHAHELLVIKLRFEKSSTSVRPLKYKIQNIYSVI